MSRQEWSKRDHVLASNNVHFSSLSSKYCFVFNLIQINLTQFWLAHCLSFSYVDTRADLLLVGLICSRSGSSFSNLFFSALFDFELMVGPKQFKDMNLGSRNNNYQLLVGLSGAHMTATSTLIASPSLHMFPVCIYTVNCWIKCQKTILVGRSNDQNWLQALPWCGRNMMGKICW